MKPKHDPLSDPAVFTPPPAAPVVERVIYRKKRSAPKRDYRVRWLVLVTGGGMPWRLMVTKQHYLLRDFGVEYRGGLPVLEDAEKGVRVTPLAPLKGYLATSVDVILNNR